MGERIQLTGGYKALVGFSIYIVKNAIDEYRKLYRIKLDRTVKCRDRYGAEIMRLDIRRWLLSEGGASSYAKINYADILDRIDREVEEEILHKRKTFQSRKTRVRRR